VENCRLTFFVCFLFQATGTIVCVKCVNKQRFVLIYNSK